MDLSGAKLERCAGLIRGQSAMAIADPTIRPN